MNMPETHLHSLMDALTRSNASFALYRLKSSPPWCSNPKAPLTLMPACKT